MSDEDDDGDGSHRNVRKGASPQDRANLSAHHRDLTADARDDVSEAHDRTSEARDETAEARDRRAESRETDADEHDSGAASDRAGARRDRRAGAGDRTHAADDREAASTDRDLSAKDRETSSIDDLTGAHTRDAGIVELQREVTRANRTQKPLVLAFIDVDGLKTTNDSLGHDAGDRLLRRVVHTIRTHLRSYDLIVRFGGDEFVCSVADSSPTAAAERFALIDADLARDPHASITTGLAELMPSDSLDDLLTRADAALRAERKMRSTSRR